MRSDPFWVSGPWSGRLAIMLRPRGGDWLEDDFRRWRRAGVDAVLSLLTPDEAADLGLADESELAAANGIQFFSFPIADRGLPPSKAVFSNLISTLAELLGNGKTVMVHCRQGIGRSALVAIGLLVSSGVDPEEAVRRVSSARGCPVPETAEQRRWILDFAGSRSAPVSTVQEIGRPQSPLA